MIKLGSFFSKVMWGGGGGSVGDKLQYLLHDEQYPVENYIYFYHVSYRVAPNCVTKAKNVRTRIFIGDQIDECKDLSGLYYLLPFQKVSTFLLFSIYIDFMCT